jgi:autotransporter adhesin
MRSNKRQSKAKEIILALVCCSFVSLGSNVYAASYQIGTGSTATGTDAAAIGLNDTASGDSSSAIGSNNIGSGKGSNAIGINNTASGMSSAAFGIANQATGTGSSAFGYNNKALTTGSTAIGASNEANAEYSSAIGIENTISANMSNSLAIGTRNKIENSNDTGTGAGGNGSIAIGYDNASDGNGNSIVGEANTIKLAIGGGVLPNGVAIGYSNKITNINGVTVGSYNRVTGNTSTTVGAVNRIVSDQSSSMGYKNYIYANANNSAILGDSSNIAANAKYSDILGSNANVNKEYGVALGANTVVDNANSVALGAGSASGDVHTAETANKVSFTIGNVTKSYDYSGLATSANGSVSVGTAGKERQMQNVAAGNITATSTDAVNGSQLYAAENALQSLSDNAVLYDGTAKDKVTLGGGTNGTTITNLKDGDVSKTSKDAINGSQLFATNENITTNTNNITNLKKTVDGGWEADVNGTKLKDVTPTNKKLNFKAGTNVTITGTGDDITIAATGGGTDSNAVLYDGTTKDKVTLGGGTNGTTITNLKDGDVSKTSKDAINGSQLFATNENVTNNTKNITANTNNITNLKKTVDGGWELQASGAKVKDVTPTSKTVNIKGDGKYVTVAADGTDVKVSTDLSKLAAADTNAVLYDGTTKDKVTLGGGTNGTTITNLKDGDVSKTSKDAINGSQLFATNENITTNTNNITNIKKTVDGGWEADVNGTKLKDVTPTNKKLNFKAGTNVTITGTGDDITIAATGGGTDSNAVLYDGTTKDKVTLGGGTNGTTITNLKDGDVSKTSKDAINGSQLFATNENVTNNTKNITANTNNITNLKKTVDGGWELQASGAKVKDVTPTSKTVNIKGDGKYVTVAADGTDVKVSTDLSKLAAADTNAVLYDGTAKDKVTLDGGTNGTTITNLKDGDVSKTSKDAINGSQLFATNENVTNNTKNITTNTNNITNLKKTVDGGWELQASGAKVKDVTPTSKTVNIKGDGKYITVAADGTDVKVSTDLSKLAAADTNAVLYDGTAKDKVTLDGGTNGTTITNLKDGDVSKTSKDAINGSQLFTTNENVTNNTKNITTNTNNITNLKKTVDGGWELQASGAKVKDVTPTSKTVNIKGDGKYITVAADGTDVKVSTDLSKLAAADTNAVLYDGTAKDKVTLGGGTNGTTITNLKDGSVSETSKDAVNGSQLYATNENVTTNTNNITNLKKTVDGGWELQASGAKVKDVTPTSKTVNIKGDGKYITVAADGTDVKVSTDLSKLAAADTNAVLYDGTPKDKVTLGGGTNGTTITNLKDGDVSKSSKDAVNGSQLYATNENVTTNTNNITSLKKTVDGGWELQASGAKVKDVTPTSKTVNIKGDGKYITVAADGTDVKVSTDLSKLAAADTNAVLYDGTPKDKVTLGGGTNGTTITNLKDGDVSKSSKDAVNGSQLYATNENVTTNTNNITNLKKTVDGGWELQASGAKVKDVTPTSKTVNIKGDGKYITVAADGTDVKVSTDLSKLVAADTNAVLYDGTPKDKVTLGGGTNGTTITNLKDGDVSKTSKDAINGSQLFATNESITNVTKNLTDLTTTVNAGWQISVNGTKVKDVTPKSKTVNFKAGTNITITGDGDDITIASTGGTGGTDSNAVHYDNKAKDKVTLEGKGGTKLTNVKDGDISTDSTDAINGGQLKKEINTKDGTYVKNGNTVGENLNALDKQVDANTGDINNLKKDFNNYNKDLGNVVKYDGDSKDKVSLEGKDGTTINNVKDGTISETSRDAVNGSQLFTTNQKVQTNTDNITNINKKLGDTKDGNYVSSSNTVGENINALDDAMSGIGSQISDVNDRVDKVGAGAAALAALHPLEFDPDAKLDVAAGVGTYHGTSAVALGAFYRPDENVMFSLGGTVGGGNNMINVGATFKLDGKNRVSRSKIAMAKEIVDLRTQVQMLANRMNGLAGLKNVTTDFPDVPKNHWAYEYVVKLAGNGIVEGYPNGKYDGQRHMTRYEMAAIIYRALQKGVAVDRRVMAEFKPELERISVDRVATNIERVRVIPGRG